MNIRTLQQRKAKLVADARAMLDAVGDAEFSADDQAKFDAVKADIAKLDAAIAREAEQIEIERSVSSHFEAPAADEPRADDERRGFRNLGEFVRAVHGAAVSPSRIDERLLIGAAAPTTYGNIGSGEDGGFLVPPEFSRSIFTLALTDEALLPLVDNVPVSGNSMVFPDDESTPWGSDGVRAYWQAEASLGTQTKPKAGAKMQRLHKMMALVPLTDELVEDSVAGGAYLAPLFARAIRWKTNEAILLGSGVGQPLGMFTSAASVVQAKESGQAANTLKIENVANMIARLPEGALGESRWLITPDALPALFTMTLGNYPVYLPANAGAQGSPYGTLMGRPVFPSQHAAAFSSQGDLMLIAPSWYRAITKAGAGVRVEQSMHLYFDADAVAFRATFRVDGAPKIKAPISQAKGSKTLSPFIQLGAR